MMARLGRSALFVVPVVAALWILGPAEVSGVVQPPHVPGDGHRMGTDATPLRAGRDVVHGVVPPRAARPWARLQGELGPSWASWDRATGVPTRVFGRGLAAPGAVANPDAARRQAEDFLARHLDLLAPGATWSDFELVSNHESQGIRSLGFRQLHGGTPVVGGAVSVRFKADKLAMVASTAIPIDRVEVQPDAGTLAAGRLIESAANWILHDVPGAVISESVPALEPELLPVIDDVGVVEVRRVVAVDLRLRHPESRWTVWVDARTGQPVAREQTLRFAELPVVFRVPDRGPWDGARSDRPAARMAALVDGATTNTDEAGVLDVPDAATSAVLSAAGELVTVTNLAGDPALFSVDLGALAGAPAQWDAADDELTDAQLTTYVYTNEVKDYVRPIGSVSAVDWLDESMPANVNIDDACNAFWDSRSGSINFFAAGEVSDTSCENTGRLVDVINHEFGHGIHDRALIDEVGVFDVALSEGISDYLAATIVDDPDMGRGFFGDDRPIRRLDPEDYEWHWPEDRGEVHAEGRIIGGTLWDLRKAFIELYGEQDGVAMTDLIWFEATRRASDIPSMYFETLLVDDDDGDLSNGTPHDCLITDIFGRHGLYQAAVTSNPPAVSPVSDDGLELSFEVRAPFPECGIETAAVLEWRLRRQPEFAGQTPFEIDEGGDTDTYRVTLPPMPSGTVVQYRAVVDHDNGSTQTRPYNLQDPWYETFIGDVEPIYCTDFETDPELDGWTHGGSDDADEWAWGEPRGLGGDPDTAFSGARVFGQDLGGDEGDGNGKYRADAATWARSPVIDVSGYAEVRLQYRRWLEVEDGYYDQARLLVDDEEAWLPFATPEENSSSASKHHRDGEWRFHDLSLTPFADDGEVQLTFDLASDGGLHMGGWTLDDLCVVGYEPVNVCGDAILELGEDCDDGNTKNGDGCSKRCTLEDGEDTSANGDDDGGCACGVTDGPNDRGLLAAALALLGLAGWRRRRRDGARDRAATQPPAWGSRQTHRDL